MWLAHRPPSVSEWLTAVNCALPYKKYHFYLGQMVTVSWYSTTFSSHSILPQPLVIVMDTCTFPHTRTWVHTTFMSYVPSGITLGYSCFSMSARLFYLFFCSDFIDRQWDCCSPFFHIDNFLYTFYHMPCTTVSDSSHPFVLIQIFLYYLLIQSYYIFIDNIVICILSISLFFFLLNKVYLWI